MSILTEQQIQQMRTQGLTDEKIATLAQQKGFELPKTPAWQKVLNTALGFTTLGMFAKPNIPPKAAPIVGGVIGGMAGGIPGAGVGTALGETYKQVSEKISGTREKIEPAQIVGQGIMGSLAEGVGTKILAPIATKIVSKIPKEGITRLLSKASGFTDDMVDRLMTRSQGVLKGYKEDEAGLLHLVRSTAKKVQEYARTSLEESKELLNQVAKQESLGGPGAPTSRNILLKEGGNFVNSIKNTLRTEHNIGVASDGTLDFVRANQPSRIVSKSDQSTIQEGYRLIDSVKNNTSIKHIDSVFERLFVLTSKTPSGSPTGKETKAIINQMIDSLESFVQKTYPTYAQLIADNLEKRVGIKTLQEVFGKNSNLSGIQASKVVNQLYQIYNTGKLGVREQLESYGTKVGTDVVGQTTGALLKEGSAYSFRGGELTSRTMINKLLDTVPRTVLKNYVETGNLTGSVMQNQIINRVIKISGRTPIQIYLQGKTD